MLKTTILPVFENYANIIERVFGSGTVSFTKTGTIVNPILGALYDDEYQAFTNNFIARLNRLKAIYAASRLHLKEIIVKVNSIAGSNWKGAFAELATYDHFNQDFLDRNTWRYTPVLPKVEPPPSETFAIECGKQAVDLDGYVEGRPLYFDVKCLKDNVDEIFSGLFKEWENRTGIEGVLIVPQYDAHNMYALFQQHRQALLTEMLEEITITKKPAHYHSKVIRDLSYCITWGKGINIVERTCDPYRHAERLHTTLFNYADKFMKHERCMIVLVSFPWYNQVITGFNNYNTKLYRATARRFFCQYQDDHAQFSTFYPGFTGTQTVGDMARQLSGIVFLEDKTILGKDPDQTNVKSYVYLNPNAKNRIFGSVAEDFLHALHNVVHDNFLNDNY